MPASIVPIRRPADKPKRNARAEAVEHLEAALDTGVRGNLRSAIQAALDIANAPRYRDLTDLEYQALQPGQKLVDAKRPGLLARASRNGVRFVYRHNDPVTGKRLETSIGTLGSISLADARERWAQLRDRRMAGQSVTIIDDAVISSSITVAELVRRYVTEYAEKTKRSWRTDQRLLDKHVIPELGDRPADAITADQVQTLLASLADTPREAQKLRAVLQTLYNVAVGKTRKITMAEPWLSRDHPNPVSNVQVADHKPTIHIPTEAEIRAYAAALTTTEVLRPDIRDVLLLQLLVGTRINEAVGACWSEFDLAHGKWHIPGERMKNGDDHTVLVSKQTLILLERRKSFAASAFVFPAPTSHKRHLRSETVQNALAERRDALGVGAKFTSHSVRHALTSWAAERGYPVEVPNRVTAHRMASGIDARYNHSALNKPAAELWQAWADWLSA